MASMSEALILRMLDVLERMEKTYLEALVSPPTEIEEDFTVTTTVETEDDVHDAPLSFDAVPDEDYLDIVAMLPVADLSAQIHHDVVPPPTTTEEILVTLPETQLLLVVADQSKLVSIIERAGHVPVVASFGAEYTLALAQKVFDRLSGTGNCFFVEHGVFLGMTGTIWTTSGHWCVSARSHERTSQFDNKDMWCPPWPPPAVCVGARWQAAMCVCTGVWRPPWPPPAMEQVRPHLPRPARCVRHPASAAAPPLRRPLRRHERRRQAAGHAYQGQLRHLHQAQGRPRAAAYTLVDALRHRSFPPQPPPDSPRLLWPPGPGPGDVRPNASANGFYFNGTLCEYSRFRELATVEAVFRVMLHFLCCLYEPEECAVAYLLSNADDVIEWSNLLPVELHGHRGRCSGCVVLPCSLADAVYQAWHCVNRLFLPWWSAAASCSRHVGRDVTDHSVVLDLLSELESVCSQAFDSCNSDQFTMSLQSALMLLLVADMHIALLWLNVGPILLTLMQDATVSASAVNLDAPDHGHCHRAPLKTLVLVDDLEFAMYLQLESVNVYYHGASCGHFVPRSVLGDLEPGALDVVRTRLCSQIFQPSNHQVMCILFRFICCLQILCTTRFVPEFGQCADVAMVLRQRCLILVMASQHCFILLTASQRLILFDLSDVTVWYQVGGLLIPVTIIGVLGGMRGSLYMLSGVRGRVHNHGQVRQHQAVQPFHGALQQLGVAVACHQRGRHLQHPLEGHVRCSTWATSSKREELLAGFLYFTGINFTLTLAATMFCVIPAGPASRDQG